MRRYGVVLLLLAAAAVLVVMLGSKDRRRDPALIASEGGSGVESNEVGSDAAASTRLQARAQRPPAGSSRGTRRTPRRERDRSGRVPAAPRVGGSSTTGRGSIRGRAAVPGALARDQHRMQLHVTRVFAQDLGLASETWLVADPIRSDGTYELGGLAPGRYFVQFVLDGRAVSESLRLVLGPGAKARGKDFRFERQAVLVGYVFAELGARPLKGAAVRVVGEPPEASDENGMFTLYDLPAGTHELLVVHPDHAPKHVTIAVAERGAAVDVNIYLAPGAQARIEALAPDGSPRAYVALTLSNADHVVSATTDEAGLATFHGLAPGARYRLRRPGHRIDARPTLLVPELESVREVVLRLPE